MSESFLSLRLHFCFASSAAAPCLHPSPSDYAQSFFCTCLPMLLLHSSFSFLLAASPLILRHSGTSPPSCLRYCLPPPLLLPHISIVRLFFLVFSLSRGDVLRVFAMRASQCAGRLIMRQYGGSWQCSSLSGVRRCGTSHST